MNAVNYRVNYRICWFTECAEWMSKYSERNVNRNELNENITKTSNGWIIVQSSDSNDESVNELVF